MKTYFEIKFDEETKEVTICERGACPVSYHVSTDSLESIAEDIGRALTCYIEGIG